MSNAVLEDEWDNKQHWVLGAKLRYLVKPQTLRLLITTELAQTHADHDKQPPVQLEEAQGNKWKWQETKESEEWAPKDM